MKPWLAASQTSVSPTEVWQTWRKGLESKFSKHLFWLGFVKLRFIRSWGLESLVPQTLFWNWNMVQFYKQINLNLVLTLSDNLGIRTLFLDKANVLCWSLLNSMTYQLLRPGWRQTVFCRQLLLVCCSKHNPSLLFGCFAYLPQN